MDVKRLRRSHNRNKGLGALHSITVWASDFGLTLAQVATAEKSNEITAISEVLKLVDLTGAIITIDAMGTQNAIAKQIVEAKADYVLGLKGNQSKLHEAVVDHVAQQMENDFADVRARHYVTHDKGHGRDETRTYIQLPAPRSLPGFDQWAILKSIGMVIKHCVRDGRATDEARYSISSLAASATCFSRAVRRHWGIENSCHWSLDVTYREDESHIRDEHLRETFAWLNRFTLSFLHQHSGPGSIAMKRRRCGWDFNCLTRLASLAATCSELKTASCRQIQRVVLTSGWSRTPWKHRLNFKRNMPLP
ncbi:MAG: ISAs1 family transposase [Planctomycetia bacterium]|nr:ISAs1 family transposase [Planctomycetia bacterium]